MPGFCGCATVDSPLRAEAFFSFSSVDSARISQFLLFSGSSTFISSVFWGKLGFEALESGALQVPRLGRLMLPQSGLTQSLPSSTITKPICGPGVPADF